MDKAVFLDRDGTLIVDRGYLADSEGVELLPGTGEALARLQAAGFVLLVASNQSGVGRGFFDRSAVSRQNSRLRDLLRRYGVELREVMVCTHRPEDQCSCRKPSPAMLVNAARRWNLNLAGSYMIGDKESDVEAGRRAGCRTILLGAEDVSTSADWQVEDLPQAVRCILNHPFTVAVIPARYGSTRFPGKALAEIAGKPMIEWVYRRVRQARLVQEILIATDDRRIAETVRAFGGIAIMTSPDHPTGTDRIVEAIRGRQGDLILNVQGDEPLLPSRFLDRLIQEMVIDDSDMATIAVPFARTDADPGDPNAVKVVVDSNHRALYFSRSLIPYHRDGGVAVKPMLHWGIYAYRRRFLENFVKWPQGSLEKCEMLEQLRALENGAVIRVIEADQPTVGVDRPEDVERVELILSREDELDEL